MIRALTLAVLYAGCAQTPALSPPTVALAPAFKEGGHPWADTSAGARLPVTAWWRLFDEPDMDPLQRYRATVLGGLQRVEDQLALLAHYGAAGESERLAAASARRAVVLATRHRRAAVGLVRALGGGWSDYTGGQSCCRSPERYASRRSALTTSASAGACCNRLA